MSVFANIPLPERGTKGLSDVVESIMKRKHESRLDPYNIELLKSKAKAQEAKASEANMMSRLFGSAFDINNSGSNENSGTGNFSNSTNNSNMKSNNTDNHEDRNQQARNILMQLGKLKELPSDKRKAELNLTSGKKGLERIGNESASRQKINDAISGLEEVMSNPKYKEISGTSLGHSFGLEPMGLPIGSAIQRQYPEHADLYGKANAYMGEMIASMASRFKGPANAGIRSTIKNQKPNMGDSFAVQQGKVSAMKFLNLLADQYDELVTKYIQEGMDEGSARSKATKEMPVDKIRKQVDASREYAEKKYKEENPEKDNNSKSSSSSVIKYTVKNGKLVRI